MTNYRQRLQSATAKALLTLRRKVADLWRPKSRLKVSEWADQFAYVPREGNAEGGKYRCSRIPYQRAMLDDAVDPTILESFWMIASQMGKTLCFVIQDGYFIHQEPCAILTLYPNIDDAKAYRREKLDPFIRATEVLRDLIKSPRSRDSGNVIMGFRFPGGNYTLKGANSPSGLRQRSVRFVKQDEIDGYEANAEGDPSMQADKRADTFHNAIKLKASTPTFKGESRIDAGYERSDKQKWFCQCPKCGVAQVLEWEQMRFDEEKPEESFYECENADCRHPWTDEQRIDAVCAGEWRATAPFKGIRGRYLNGLYRIIGKKDAFRNYYHEFVAEYLKAKEGGELSLIVWENTFRSRPYARKAEQLEIQPLLERRELYAAQCPMGVLVVTAGADVHPDRIECSVWGWGEGEESWLIEHRVFTGNTSEEFVWNSFEEYIRAEFKHESGSKLSIAMTFIDAGHNTNEVYKFTKKRERFGIYACKGLSGPGSRFAPMSPAVPARNNALRAARFDVGTHAAKNQLFYRLRVGSEPDDPKGGSRYVHFPLNEGTGCDITYFEQLTAEHLISKRINGQIVKVWEIPEGEDFSGVRNEAWDCAVYASAAIFRLRPNWHALKKNFESKKIEYVKNRSSANPDEAQADGSSKDAQGKTVVRDELEKGRSDTQNISRAGRRRPSIRERGGFVGGWMR